MLDRKPAGVRKAQPRVIVEWAYESDQEINEYLELEALNAAVRRALDTAAWATRRMRRRENREG